jgi:hypothetical protein
MYIKMFHQRSVVTDDVITPTWTPQFSFRFVATISIIHFFMSHRRKISQFAFLYIFKGIAPLQLLVLAAFKRKKSDVCTQPRVLSSCPVSLITFYIKPCNQWLKGHGYNDTTATIFYSPLKFSPYYAACIRSNADCSDRKWACLVESNTNVCHP